MGGEREEVIQSQSANPTEGKIQSVRIHENKGQVHFHDDAKKLKVAVPVAVWYKAWEKLSQTTWHDDGRFEYQDLNNGTILIIVTSLAYSRDLAAYTIDSTIELSPLAANEAFQQLRKFSTAKG